MRLILLLATATLFGQQPVQDSKPARLEGKVMHAKTGEPLRKVNVTLTPSGGRGGGQVARQVTTEADGRFTFDQVTPGAYQVSAERNGFLNQRYNTGGRAQSASTLTLGAGQQMTGIDFKLIPHGVLAGKILDADGDPMQRVQVSILRVSTLGGRKRATMQSSGSTNDLGEFRVYNLPAGRYYVMASVGGGRGPGGFGPGGFGPGGFRQVQRSAAEEYVATYYPGAADTASATLVELEAGQEVSGLLFQLRRSPVFHVRGRVAGAQAGGEGQRGYRVMLTPADRTAVQVSFGPGNATGVRGDGSFDFPNVQPGSYQAVVMRADRRPVTLGRTAVTVSNGHVDGVTLVASEPVSIKGLMKVEGTQAADVSGARVVLQAIDGTPMAGVDSQVKADGTFQMDSVSRDSFTVNVSGLSGLYVRSVRLGTQDVTETGVDLSSAATAATLEITLGARPGAVGGSVKEGDKPGAGRAVTLLPDPARPMQPYLIYTQYADQDGGFNLTGVAPGNYRLYAWEEITRDLFTDPEFMKKFENDGLKVSVKEGATERLEIPILKVDQ